MVINIEDDPFIARFIQEGRTKGQAEGRVEEARKILLRLLEARKLGAPGPIGGLIGTCTELELLELWFHRAVTATSVHEIFAGFIDHLSPVVA